jgi:hypothetical protein
MNAQLSSKERLLITIRNGQADRVPVCPDISNMIPCRLTGKPFWEIFMNQNPPLWRAWVEALRYYDFDGYFNGAEIGLETDNQTEDTVVSRTMREDRWIETHVIRTPAGDLDYEWTYYPADSPTMTVKPIKDLEKDFSKVKFLFPKLLGYSRRPLTEQEAELGDRGVTAVYVSTPGFGNWIAKYFDGGAEQLIYAYYDRPDLVEELRRMNDEYATRHLEFVLDARPDCVEVGVAGGISLASPEIFRRFSLPTIQTHTKMANEAGIPSVLHCCGKQRAVVEMCARETDLNCIDPLELPPQGDCDLAEIKVQFGKELSLMGNLHTTDVMLFGTPQTVAAAARAAIDAAGTHGGFILSTGDQCGRDTPDENIFKMIEVAETYGRYE